MRLRAKAVGVPTTIKAIFALACTAGWMAQRNE
jgi:citrate synthase